MSEFTRITKEQAKVIRHLLNSASTDTARPILQAINVNIDNDCICSADGFMLTFVKYKGSGLESIFPVSGNFNIIMGKIQREDIIEVSQLTNSDYPNLAGVLHGSEKPAVFTFSISKGLLTRLLKEANPQVMVKVWDKVQPVEISYRVSLSECYSAIMPMHTPDEIDTWHPKEYVKPANRIEPTI
jgi:DNA polymerase III sliding clamp (beta) subunit (PCNA family)